MPYGKRRKNTKRSKYTRNHRRKTVARPQTRLGWPISKSTKLKYVDSVVLNIGAAGVPGKYVFRANSIYDPDLTGAGHQPMMHDLWESLYNHYVVSGAKISVKCYDPVPITTTPQLVGIMLNDDTSTPVSWQEVLEQGKAKYTVITGGQDHPKTVSQFFSAKTFFNVADVKDNIHHIGALQSTNPTEEAYFTIFALPYDQTSDLGPIRVIVTIEYSVVYSEPKDQALN